MKDQEIFFHFQVQWWLIRDCWETWGISSPPRASAPASLHRGKAWIVSSILNVEHVLGLNLRHLIKPHNHLNQSAFTITLRIWSSQTTNRTSTQPTDGLLVNVCISTAGLSWRIVLLRHYFHKNLLVPVVSVNNSWYCCASCSPRMGSPLRKFYQIV